MSLIGKIKGLKDKLLPSAQVTKLVIEAFASGEKNAVTDTSKGSFVVPFNPNSLTLKVQINRTEVKAANNVGTVNSQFESIPPQDFSFEILLDNTGFTKNGLEGIGSFTGFPAVPGKSEDNTVSKAVAKFASLVAEFDGKNHETNYLKISYGKLIVKCVLVGFDVTYTLFDKSGLPLRAKINATFRTSGNETLDAIIQGKQSPDLTKVRTLNQYDHYLTKCYEMYEDNHLYVQAAYANKMNRIRENKTGQTIIFPPLKDQTETAK